MLTLHCRLQASGHLLLRRALSSTSSSLSTTGFNLSKPIKVLVGTQTGTAMGFAQCLRDSAEERGITTMEVVNLEDYEPSYLLSGKDPQVVLVMSCYGVGEPTDSAKPFYSKIMTSGVSPQQQQPGTLCTPPPGFPRDLRFTVFGLGSSKTHKNNYNIVGKSLDHQLFSNRVFDLGLGDDSSW